MVQNLDPFKLSSPRGFLFRMVVFLVLAALLAFVLQGPIRNAFMANPLLNSVILAVMVIGIILAFRQVVRLFPEVNWVNGFRLADPGIAVAQPPVLLAPMAAMLGDRTGRMVISPMTMRSMLDSVGTRLDEGREIGRYLVGLLVFLGLLGTFYGLIETVTSVSKVIASLSSGGELGAVFEDMKKGLAEPLAGMGIAFSSSLFGLAGSLVLGFLDLQSGQAQNRFYTEVEDWLATTVRDIGVQDAPKAADGKIVGSQDLAFAFERLRESLAEQPGQMKATAAMVNLAESLQGLVNHVRTEQETIKTLMAERASDHAQFRELIEVLIKAQKKED